MKSMLVPTALLAPLLLAPAACKTSQIGVTNRLGTIKTMLDSPPDRVIAAAEEVLREMDLEILEARSTSLDGRVEARTANDRPILVKTELAGNNVSEVSIRVGSTLGDEALSLQILNRIKERLNGEMEDEAVPSRLS